MRSRKLSVRRSLYRHHLDVSMDPAGMKGAAAAKGLSEDRILAMLMLMLVVVVVRDGWTIEWVSRRAPHDDGEESG